MLYVKINSNFNKTILNYNNAVDFATHFLSQTSNSIFVSNTVYCHIFNIRIHSSRKSINQDSKYSIQFICSV